MCIHNLVMKAMMHQNVIVLNNNEIIYKCISFNAHTYINVLNTFYHSNDNDQCNMFIVYSNINYVVQMKTHIHIYS